MMFPRLVALAGSAALVVLVLGCAQEKPVFDQATLYSSETLAQELSFRFKSIDRRGDGTSRDPGAITKSGVTKGGGAVTKQAGTQSLQGLIDDVAEKLGKVQGMSRTEAAKKVAELVSKDQTIPGADRKAIAEKLTKSSSD